MLWTSEQGRFQPHDPPPVTPGGPEPHLPMRLLSVEGAPSTSCGNSTVPLCVLKDLSDASYSTGRIVCSVEAGVGSNFEGWIRELWVALSPLGSAAIATGKFHAAGLVHRDVRPLNIALSLH